MTVRMPLIGPIINFLLNKRVQTSILIKLACLLIASLGSLLGLIIFLYYFNNLYFLNYWVIFIISLCSAINLTYEILFFKTLDKDLILNLQHKYGEKLVGFNWLDRLSAKNRNEMMRTLFADIHIPQLFETIFNFSLIIFSATHLFSFPNQRGHPLTLIESIEAGFSFLSFSSSDFELLKSTEWKIILGVFKFIIFYWLVLFVSIAPSLFIQGNKNENNDQELHDEEFANLKSFDED